MRACFDKVAGNTALRKRLGADIAQNAFSHAYILAGEAGCGKSTLALEMAMAIACEHRGDETHPLPCRTCPACQKIAAGNSPDIIHIQRESGKATMGVDTVRDLRTDVHTYPNDLSVKIYIIHDAHTMTVQAQNALLLTLEEPPAFVLFFLLAEDPAALLETIRSRAPVLRMQPVSEAEIKAYLLSHERAPKIYRAAALLEESAPEELAAVLRMAGGRIGEAMDLLEESKRTLLMERREETERLCRLLADRTRPDEALVLLLAFGSKRDEVSEKLLLLESALRDLLLLCYSEAPALLFFTDVARAADLSSRFTAARLLQALQAVRETLGALAANGNVRLLLVRLQNKLFS